VQEFIVIAIPRSGSTLLQEALHARPDTYCSCELLHGHREIAAANNSRAAKLKGLELTLNDDIRHLFHDAPAKPGFEFIGTKECIQHIKSEYLPRICQGRRIIILERHPIAVAASFGRASRARLWNRYTDGTFMTGQPPKAEMVEPFAIAREHLQTIESLIIATNQLKDKGALSVTYEELVTFPEATYNRVCSYLGMPPSPLVMKTAKAFEDSPLNQVSNLEEALSWCTGTLPSSQTALRFQLRFHAMQEDFDPSDLRRRQGLTIWFTGLSGSGKSTLSTLLESELQKRRRACYRLDGDAL
jgi:hypothetical protein